MSFIQGQFNYDFRKKIRKLEKNNIELEKRLKSLEENFKLFATTITILQKY